jgi:hypothetical protein
MDIVLEVIIPLIVLAYTVYAIIKRMDGRIPVGIALGLLVLAAVILAVGNEGLANDVAILCYYMLVSGVVVQFVEYLREEKNDKDTSVKPWKK